MIPNTLPTCDLIQILADKANNRHDIEFNFLAKLDDFRKRVSDEVRQINALFPEYTPHDEQYHLKRLFHVASTVLGRARLEEMNSAELFILAVALFGHDWGMAVNEIEKQYILSGDAGENKVDDLWVLSDERQHITKFVRDQRLKVDANGAVQEIATEQWREYVRQTHAFRSGERVRRYFKTIDGGIADAASRVCIGHWLGFEDLQDYRSYPSNFSALGETVNLRALAVYLRLIDLLDLAEDRTPYVIWKFVAPRDSRSKMEWAKHRALRPITCQSYQEGRIIQVDGSTDDHEVYAALEDLRIWGESQLRGCNDVLARMNDPRHKLDIYHIDWRVEARRFKPVLIQFEFDRSRMFEILGDEIYQSDQYVFLRELLQNSIDAIRMRREILKRKGITPANLGVIQVDVQHQGGGDAIVTWRDDGIGMDEYVIRNYVAVAGKSYYHSADFEREGLKMDPISTFGIGLLSCFMVANQIEIETFKDPYLPPPGEPLKIVIPAVTRQFRIEVGVRETAKVGTTIRVFVEGKKLPIDSKDGQPTPLNVTNYLSIVAGFVEFPIIINEEERKTILVHPKHDIKSIRQKHGEEFQVRRIDLTYPWTDAIVPQDIPIAQEFLQEKQLDIAQDLALEGYEGVLSFLTPKKENCSLRSASPTIEIVGKKIEKKAVRPIERWVASEKVGSRSARTNRFYCVYRDGILVPQAPEPRSFRPDRFRTSPIPQPRIVINLPKSIVPKVDLARTQILKQPDHWYAPVFETLLHYLAGTTLKDLFALPLVERLLQLGRFMSIYNVSANDLWDVLPHEAWPMPFLESGGHLKVLDRHKVKEKEFHIAPHPIGEELSKLAEQQWVTHCKYKGMLTQWVGRRCLILITGDSDKISIPIWNADSIGMAPLRNTYEFAAVGFLEPPWNGNPPLYEQIWLPLKGSEQTLDDEDMVNKFVSGQYSPRSSEYKRIGERYGRGCPRVVDFAKPYDKSFAYGGQLLNCKHPVTQALFVVLAKRILVEKDNALPKAILGLFDDAVKELFGEYGQRDIYRWEEWARDLRKVWSLAHEMKIFDSDVFEEFVPRPDEFVPGTVGGDVYKLQRGLVGLSRAKPFGQPITKRTD